MAAKTMIVLSAIALIVQSVKSQCLPVRGCGCNGIASAASSGGSFVVTSASPVAPTGVSVVSDNLYEGVLLVEGDLPLLGSVAVEGTMGTAGAGAVSYGCGDGAVGIVAEEGPIVTGIAPEAAADYGLGNGLFGLGYGGLCGLGYGNGLYGFGNGLYGFGNGLGGFGNGLYGFGKGLYGFGNGLCGLRGCGYGLGAFY